ncbi:MULTISPECIES: GtrA family protein [Halobacteriales]|uniref:GtrA family protein n=2 Tax=Halobacteriales TaxID=2235 RepID=M0C176_9EURY|nr:GtrA family protein [Natrinema limicola]ELZ17001.1 GtrA family protein [Natrinema limicola JCM 13563]
MIQRFLRNLISSPIAPQLRRFVAVGIIAAGVQMMLLWVFVDKIGLYYLIGGLIAIEITIVLSYVLNNLWTFRASRNTGTREYFVGLLKTNVVRGTAIPIQLAILLLLVELGSIPYLLGNAVAIALSGIYRYVLDARWTWG